LTFNTQKSNQSRRISGPGTRLALAIGIMVFLVTLTHLATEETIAIERKKAADKLLKEIAGSRNVSLEMITPDHYITRDANDRKGSIVKTSTFNGYNGEIKLWIGINDQGTVTGVRVIEHRETPGLGDKILPEVSDWILGFNGKSLLNPQETSWKVKKDGGEFDQFTGATITPRAIVAAVHKSLLEQNSTGKNSTDKSGTGTSIQLINSQSK
jgi:electron transport complex protein RnfG